MRKKTGQGQRRVKRFSYTERDKNSGRLSQGWLSLFAARVIVLAVSYFVVAENADVDVSKRISGAARIGVIGETVLSAKLAIDLIENDAKFGEAVGKEHGASGGFRNGL